jgi:hypothetical protein
MNIFALAFGWLLIFIVDMVLYITTSSVVCNEFIIGVINIVILISLFFASMDINSKGFMLGMSIGAVINIVACFSIVFAIFQYVYTSCTLNILTLIIAVPVIMCADDVQTDSSNEKWFFIALTYQVGIAIILTICGLFLQIYHNNDPLRQSKIEAYR